MKKVDWDWVLISLLVLFFVVNIIHGSFGGYKKTAVWFTLSENGTHIRHTNTTDNPIEGR